MIDRFEFGKVLNFDASGHLMTDEEWEAEKKRIADSTGRCGAIVHVDRKTKVVTIRPFDSLDKKKT